MKYVLKHPFKWGDRDITEFEYRRPKGKDIFDIKGNPSVEDLARVASKISSIELPVIKDFDIEDFSEVLEIVGNFLTSSQGTGDSASH